MLTTQTVDGVDGSRWKPVPIVSAVIILFMQTTSKLRATAAEILADHKASHLHSNCIS